jgi:proteasome lid subunit RPN8/RPN11
MRFYKVMNSLLKPLKFVPGLWGGMMEDLQKRSGGEREAGAFLCSSLHSHRVCRWISYDELDPASLHFEYVRLEPAAFGCLAEVCNAGSLLVVGDIHCHPEGAVQSESDRRYPMICIAGHVALIVPRFARGVVTPSDVSFNLYCGNQRWRSYFGQDASALIVAP